MSWIAFSRTLSQEERDRFHMNGTDTVNDTIMALVEECIKLRKRIEVLES